MVENPQSTIDLGTPTLQATFHNLVLLWLTDLAGGRIEDMDENIPQIGDFSFQEPETGEECWAGVRAWQGQVILSLSRKSDGDIQVAFDQRDAERLIALLGQAIAAP